MNPIDLHKHGVAALAALAMMTGAVGAGCAQEEDGAEVAVRVEALSSAAIITRVRLSSQPDGTSVDLTAGDGGFAGSLLVPAGEHTFSVDAFAGDARIGRGSATATVVANTVTALQIALLDTTGQAPAPGHSPIVLSFAASNAQPRVGESVGLDVNAVDPDGDAIAYAWSSSCSGTFSRADTAAASWSPTAAGTCAVRLDMTAGIHTVSRTVNIEVLPPLANTGTVDVNAFFVANPILGFIRLYDPNTSNVCITNRDTTDATCETTFGAGQQVYVYVDGGFTSFTDSCGGSLDDFNRWTTPATSRVCLLTWTKTESHGLSDTVSVALLVK